MRVAFVRNTLRRYLEGQPRSCPYCGLASERVGRKKLLLELRRCRDCGLMYRYPKDEVSDSAEFYQAEYAEGMTTDLPDAENLARWMRTGFAGTEKDLTEKIALVRRLCRGGRLLDYGCSWGYGVLQFERAGFNAVGFEISIPRARFGQENLGVEILSSRAEVLKLAAHSFDVIFANHVVEHLSDPRSAFEDFRRLLRSGGVLFIFVPNAGGRLARQLGPRWGPMIGEKHPLAIDAPFLARNLPSHGLASSFWTSPYPSDALSLETDPCAPTLSGDELLAVARVGGGRS